MSKRTRGGGSQRCFFAGGASGAELSTPLANCRRGWPGGGPAAWIILTSAVMPTVVRRLRADKWVKWAARGENEQGGGRTSGGTRMRVSRRWCAAASHHRCRRASGADHLPAACRGSGSWDAQLASPAARWCAQPSSSSAAAPPPGSAHPPKRWKSCARAHARHVSKPVRIICGRPRRRAAHRSRTGGISDLISGDDGVRRSRRLVAPQPIRCRGSVLRKTRGGGEWGSRARLPAASPHPSGTRGSHVRIPSGWDRAPHPR
eukprot:4436656-Prymnesium_polylepis.2